MKNKNTNLLSISGKIGSGKDTAGKIIQYLTSPFDRDTQTVFDPKEDYDILNGYKIKKFADKLKDIVCLIIGCTREHLEDPVFKETPLGEAWNKTVYHIYTDEGGLLISHTNKDNAEHDLNHYSEYYHNGEAKMEEEEIIMTPRLLLQLTGTEFGRNLIHENVWVNSLFSEYKKSVESRDSPRDINLQHPKWIITDTRFPNELQAIKDRGGITILVDRGLQENNLVSHHLSEIALSEARFDYHIDNLGSIEDLVEKMREILIKENIL